MTLNVSLRSATEQDSEFVYLVKKAALGEYIEQTWGWDEAFQRQFHAKDYEPGRTQIIVENGSDVGWMLLAETDQDFRLQEIYLRPEHQNRGIGSYLIGLLIGKADRQRKPIQLTVLKVNGRARRLYERLGFEVAGETGTDYVMRRVVA